MIATTGSYCGSAPTPAALSARWNGDPVLGGMLALALAGAVAARSRAGMFAVAVLAIAFLSPLCAAGVALFSARTIHHLLLLGVAAPLLAAALPVRRAIAPLPALVGSSVILWAWHLPTLYDAALADKTGYWAMQATLLGSATLYWHAVRAAAAPVAIPVLVAGAAQMGMLGAILTFAPRPLYASHLATTVPFGIGPLGDQQLAGLLMWTLGMLPYATIAALRMRGEWRRMRAVAA